MANTTRNLKYVLEAIKKGQGVGELNAELKGLEAQGKDTTKQTKAFNAEQAAMVAASVAATKAIIEEGIELIELGGQVTRSKVALEAFAGSSTAADQALQGVIEASGGALDKMSAAQNAARLFSMGLADTATEAEELARIGITLGTAMGRDTQTAFEEFSLLLANQSIPRLDTFGISAGQTRQRINELMAEVDGLQRDEAFKLAVVELGTQRLQELEAQGYQSATGLEQVKASANNAKQAFGELLFGEYEDSGITQAITWITDGLGEWLDQLNEMESNSNQLWDLVDSGVLQVVESQEQLIYTTSGVISYFEDVNIGEQWAMQADEIGGASAEATQFLESLAFAEENLGIKTEDLVFTTQAEIDEFVAMVGISKDAMGVTYAMVDANEELNSSEEKVAESLADVNLNLSNTIEKQKDAIRWIEAGGKALEKEAEIIEDEYIGGLISAEEAQRRFTDVQIESMVVMGEFDGLTLDEIYREIDELGGTLWDARLIASGLYNTVKKMDGLEAYMHIYIQTHGSVPKPGAGSSGSSSGSGGGTGTSSNPNPSGGNYETEFAEGGRFEVDGMPGRDKVPVTLLMEKGEVGLVYNKEQQRNLNNIGGGGERPVIVNVYVDGRRIQQSLAKGIRMSGGGRTK